MKQVLQSLKTGQTILADIPRPQLKPGTLLIQTRQSLISSGTEKMLLDFGKANLLDKARQQPERVSMVLDKIKTDGLLPTIDAVRNKLDQLLTMGYCNVGTVVEVSADITDFKPGDRVVSNGAHAEMVIVPRQLCCKIPDTVRDDYAVFTILGAIALQGVRLAQPTLGECFVVMGLGLVGLLTVQLLRAQGCRVLGVDFAADKIALAKGFGADVLQLTPDADVLAHARAFSREHGVDGVLITASTDSDEPMHQAAQMCRKRGRIILVGVTGLALSRADFYEKELSFQVSCSYGPGRYDKNYEEQGHDYPIGFVRWTEQRNFEAFLDMLANHNVDVSQLISHRFPITEAREAYELLGSGASTAGILISYPLTQGESAPADTIRIRPPAQAEKQVRIGLIGAGNYANRVLIPAMKKTSAAMQTIACSSGVSGTLAGSKFGFEQVTTNTEAIFSDPNINTVVIASRHDTHARFVCEALRAGKHVYVEKPLCLNHQELAQIVQAANEQRGILMAGFNRRFAPHISRIKALLQTVPEPSTFIYMVNAGDIPRDHWIQHPESGGGRIIGEACHFIDLLCYLAGPVTAFHITRLAQTADDKVSISLSFANGSFGVIHYLANGHRAFPKERLEIFTAGRVLQLNNFRSLRAYGWGSFKRMNLWRQDKGQNLCVNAFVNAIQSGLPSPISMEDLIATARLTFDIAAVT